MLKLRSRSPLLWLGVAVFVFASSLASAQQATIDPQALIGTWSGTWTNAGFTGQYYMTLTRFEDGTYYGRYQSSSTILKLSDLQGKLAADVFTYVTVPTSGSGEFKVDGDKMTGEVCGGRGACFYKVGLLLAEWVISA
jgi:hypothetical protein